MKQVKGKYIRLTEQQLNNIVTKEVEKQLQLIMEYAEPRKKFVDRCASLFKQILENWCLCRYCTLSGVDVNMCHNHWRGELNTHLTSIAESSIKKNNAVEVRNKAIVEGFDEVDAFNGSEYNWKKIINKFRIEGIDYKNAMSQQCAEDFCNELPNIINLLAKADLMEISEYSYSI